MTSSAFSPELSIENGTFAVRADGRELLITDVSLALHSSLDSRRRHWVSLKNYKHRAFSDGGYIFDDDSDLPKVALRARVDGDEFVCLQLKIYPKNSSWFLEGSRIEFDYRGQGEVENLQSFFSHFSFAFNGVMKERAKRIAWVDGAPAISKTENVFYRERAGLAWWATALKSVGDAKALFLGAESARIFKTTLSLHKHSGLHRGYVYWGLHGEIIPLTADAPIDGDAVAFAISGGVLRTMREYGARVARRHRAIPSEPRRGWSSWYKYYTRISEKTILQETAALKKRLPGFDLLQIDDGYQAATGDWQRVQSGFRGGLQSLAKKIADQGLKPGIWLAPFLVDVKSQTARQSPPEWFLRDRHRKPLVYKIPKHSHNWILDLSHSDSLEWLATQVKAYRAWGYRYLKIDFLFLAAAEARRHDPRVTGMEAYRRGLATIRQAAGDDTTLLLSGSIDIGAIGIGNANRTGPDIAYDFFGGHTRPAFIQAQLAATASHFFQHHQWFTPNADALMIRPPLADSLVEVMIAQVAMTGGDYILSDNLEAVAKLRLGKLVLPAVNELAASRGTLWPLDLFAHASPMKVMPNPLLTSWFYRQPEIWLKTDGSQCWLILFNLAKREKRFQVGLRSLIQEMCGQTLFEGNHVGTDVFRAETTNVRDGHVDITVPPESVRAYAFKF